MPAGRPRIVRTPLEAAQVASDGRDRPVQPTGRTARAALRAAGLSESLAAVNSGPQRVWVNLRMGLEEDATERVRAVLASLWADGDTRVISHPLLVLVDRSTPVPMPPGKTDGDPEPHCE